MAETWLTMEKVCALTGWSPGHARRASRTWPTRLTKSRGPNGKQRREYPLNSLPADAQAKHAEETRKGLAIVRATEQTLPLFASVPALPSPRVAIPEDLEDQARARLKAIEPYLDAQQQRKEGQRKEIRFVEGKIVRTLDEFAEYIGSQQNPPVRKQAIWEWVARFKKGGYAALADSPRKDRDKSRFFEEHPAAGAYLQQKFLKEGLSRQMAWEALCRDWRRIGEKGLTPCYDTARNFLNALPEPLKVLAREGKQAHWSKCSPFIQRSKVPVMDWWVSDHREFDVLVRNTIFGEMKQDQAYRLWLTALYDWGSRKIVGFCLAPTPSKRTINSSIRMGVLGHSFPRNFYWDNGKDYGSARADLELITLSEEAQALLERNRIGITSAIPKRPRSKPIESWFARWSKRFDVLWRPAYVGNAPGNRPEDADESQKQHAKFLAGKRGDSPLPTDAEFIVATVQWIEEYNETRLETLDHRTPNEVMEEAHPERNRPKVNPRLLDILFSERAKRVVQAGGCVQLDRMCYEPTDESLFALDGKKGQQVMVLRDPYNLGEATAADAETLQFIGELRIQEFIAQCPNGQITRDQIKAAERRGRGLRRGYADYLAVLSAVASNQGWQTEREALMDRAIARTGTDGRLLPAAVPGARGDAPKKNAAYASPFVSDSVARCRGMFDDIIAQPAFVSDAVAEDGQFWRDNPVELEDSGTDEQAAVPVAAVPGALRNADHPAAEKMSSPFVDDAVRDFLADESDVPAKEDAP
jgi:transposase InsO family protein